jgi:hypothetical protein
MNDQTILILLAFIIGFLTRHIISSDIFMNLKWHVKRYTPQRCPRCKTWHLQKDLRGARHNVVGWVKCCRDCYDELYNPLTSKNQ